MSDTQPTMSMTFYCYFPDRPNRFLYAFMLSRKSTLLKLGCSFVCFKIASQGAAVVAMEI